MSRTPLEKATGAPGYLKLRGKTYRCNPLRLRHFAEARAFLVQLAPDPLKELQEDKATFESFSPEIQKALALKALDLREQRKNVLAEEANTWVNGEEGALFLLWCMVRDHHPEYATLDALLATFPPGDEKAGLTIPEAELIRRKIDEITLEGLTTEAVDKKKAEDQKRRKKLKRLRK